MEDMDNRLAEKFGVGDKKDKQLHRKNMPRHKKQSKDKARKFWEDEQEAKKIVISFDKETKTEISNIAASMESVADAIDRLAEVVENRFAWEQEVNDNE